MMIPRISGIKINHANFKPTFGEEIKETKPVIDLKKEQQELSDLLTKRVLAVAEQSPRDAVDLIGDLDGTLWDLQKTLYKTYQKELKGYPKGIEG